MKRNTICKLSLFLAVVSLCLSCGKNVHTSSEPELLVQRYYQAFNDNDFEAIRSSIADSIKQISGPYTESWSKESFVNWIEWDASFNPVYQVHDTQVISENKVEITISKNCKRIQFLNEEPTKYREIFYFENNKIKTIEAGEYLVFNDSLWVAKRDTLIAYINREHPDLDGFIYDQTKRGAENYLKAIALYKEAHNITN